MKIGFLNSILSCNAKCIRITLAMINKKIIFGLFLFSILGACGAPTAMLGPAYTFTTTGNITQAGLSYGSDHLITSYTGKSTIENIEDITSKNLPVKKNIQKQTLQSEDFYQLVKSKIEMTKGKIKLSNQ
tara:strand:+ start:154 stop:543 length:390 start_codon:yes stop_codon:yes gene_type:complete